MPWDTDIRLEDDPCLAQYPNRGITAREIHVNLSLHQVRVYIRTGSVVRTFGPTIEGDVTANMARSSSNWCHIHQVVNKTTQSQHGLLNFVVFCPRREIGFHSDMWMRDGRRVRIPGDASAGCIRIPHAQSRAFYDLVRDGDGVRLYRNASWRPPLFAFGRTHDHCKS